MKNTVFLIVTFCFLMISCNSLEKDFEEQIQGEWELVSTSGGFAGAGTSTVWDLVSIDGDEFILSKMQENENEFIASGNIISKGDTTEENLFEFDLENTTIDDLGIEIDPEKFIEVENDKMDWLSPCCDRFNYHFEKM